jgi:hypothetical protein
MNSTTKKAEKDAGEFNQLNENSDKKGRHSTHKSKIMRVLKEKIKKQYIASILQARTDSLLVKKTRS